MPDAPTFVFDPVFQDLVAAHVIRRPGACQMHESYLQPGYISNPVTAMLVSLTFSHFKKHKSVPSEPVLRELIRQSFPELNSPQDTARRNTHEAKLSELYQMPLGDDEFVDAKVGEFARFVGMRDLVISTYEELKDLKYAPDIPDKFRQALAVGQNQFDVGHMWREKTDDRVRDSANPDHDARVPTGLPHLDSQIGGGIKPGELGILLALPKGYKSGTMMNFGFSALRESVGLNVAYITLELSEELVGLRFDYRCSLMGKDQLMADPEEFLSILKERQEVLCGNNELLIKGFKTKTCTCDTIRTYLDMLYSKLDIKVGMLIVDYLDLLKSTRPRDKDYLEAVDIAEDLRSIASPQEYRIPVWTAARATREAVGKKRISMNEMSKSFERVGIADMVLALCMTEQEKAERKMRIVPVAMRNDSGDKVVDCVVNYEKMLLTSVGLSEPDYEEDVPKKFGKKKDEDVADPRKKNLGERKANDF